MTIQEIKDIIGREQYQQTSRAHLEQGRRANRDEQMNVWTVPDDIRDLIWDEAGSDLDKVTLTFEAYADMPCYALLTGVSWNYDDISVEARDLFWTHMCALLGAESEIRSEPAAYTLWCDYFERSDRVERAWSEVTAETVDDVARRRALIASGPVPFALKEPLYTRLITGQKWHYYIFRSLLHSTFDYFGKVDKAGASSLLSRLNLPPETENLARLQQALQG